MADDKYTMLYCDTTQCRVNEFEAGANGRCPGCGAKGIRLDTHEEWV